MRKEIIVDAVSGQITEVDLPEPEALNPAEVLAAERATMICSRFQAKAALLRAGLLSQVETLMSTADPLAQLAWAEAIEFRRDSSTMLALAAQINLSPEQLDDLFRAAMLIRA